MSKSIENRITALADALRRQAEMQLEPIDSLSASLFEFERELAALDEQGKAALLKAMNNPDDVETDSLHLTMQDIEQMIDHWRPR